MTLAIGAARQNAQQCDGRCAVMPRPAALHALRAGDMIGGTTSENSRQAIKNGGT